MSVTRSLLTLAVAVAVGAGAAIAADEKKAQDPGRKWNQSDRKDKQPQTARR